MHFELIGEIEDVEIIAVGGKIRDISGFGSSMVPGDGENLKVVLKSSFRAAAFAQPRSIGMKPMESAKRK